MEFFQMKKNQFFLGNCHNLINQIPSKSIHLSFSDPPYFILNKTDLQFKKRSNVIQSTPFDNFESYEVYIEFIAKTIELLSPKFKDDSYLLWFFAAQYITDLKNLCETNDMKFKQVLTWHKLNPMLKVRKTAGFISASETLLLMARGNPQFHFLNQKKMHNVINWAICSGNERIKDLTKINKNGNYPNIHPTQKPEGLCNHFLIILSSPKNVIFDPFAGVATINACCKKRNRYCTGFEIHKPYYDAGINRLEILSNRLGNTFQSQLFE
jgi:DNA modification methylase